MQLMHYALLSSKFEHYFEGREQKRKVERLIVIKDRYMFTNIKLIFLII
jgi:hypothetical protein